MRPHKQQPTRLPHPWDSPGKNTGVGCHFPPQCRKVKSESDVTQLCPTLSDPMDYSLPGFSFHGIFQARVLEWIAIAFSVEQASTQHKKECTTDTRMTRMNLKCIIWSKISQIQKTASFGAPFIWYLKRQNIRDRNQISGWQILKRGSTMTYKETQVNFVSILSLIMVSCLYMYVCQNSQNHALKMMNYTIYEIHLNNSG